MTAPHHAQEATNPSDTPRTDAEEYELQHTFAGSSMRPCRDGGWVDADFARTLEHELAQSRAEVERLRSALEELMVSYRIVAISQMVLRGYTKEEAVAVLGPNAPVCAKVRALLNKEAKP